MEIIKTNQRVIRETTQLLLDCIYAGKTFRYVTCSVAIILMASLTNDGFSQTLNYPDRPIRLIIPFAPGGGADIVGRLIANQMSEVLGQQVVADNRGGAGGAIGAELAVRATPNGYTLIMGSASYAISPSIHTLPYDAINDVSPVAQIAAAPFVVVTHPTIKAINIKELIVLAKTQPGKLNFGSSGTGGITHLATELFKLMARVDMTHVPYKGNGPALVDLIAGQIDLIFLTSPVVGPHIRSGKLRALAVTSSERMELLPETPTIAESGVPDYEVMTWYAVWGPKGIPRSIIARWNSEINRLIQTPQMRERLAAGGLVPTPGTPSNFAKILKRDIERWKLVVKEANISTN